MSKKKRGDKLTTQRARLSGKPRKEQILESIKIERAIKTQEEKNTRIAAAISKLTETKKKGDDRVIELSLKLEEVKAAEAQPQPMAQAS